MQLENIDWLIISAFFVSYHLVNWSYSFKKVREGHVTEFFLSGRKMPWWLLGISMVATTFSADTPNLGNGYCQNKWSCRKLGLVGIFINRNA